MNEHLIPALDIPEQLRRAISDIDISAYNAAKHRIGTVLTSLAPHLVKRPVAFRVPRIADDKLSETEWRLFSDEEAARQDAENKGTDYQGLYVRDGSAIVSEWEPIETAPKDPDATFLVCAVGDERGPFVVRASILWQARKAGTPSHLGLSHLTHWMPLPAMPVT